MEWSLFRSAIISSAAEHCGRKWLRSSSEKRIPWWIQDVEEAIRAKKNAYKALLQNRSALDLQSRNLEARKAANSAVKHTKEKMLRKVWSSAGIKLQVSEQNILEDHPPFTWYRDQIPQPPLRMLKATFSVMKPAFFQAGENTLRIF